MELLKEEAVLPDYAEKYLLSLKQKNRQPSTLKRYRYDLIDIFEWIKFKHKSTSLTTWCRLTPNEIEEYFHLLLIQRKYKIRTFKRVATVVNQLYRFTIENGWANLNPMENIVMPELKETDLSYTDFLSDVEVKKLLHIIHSSSGLTEKQKKARAYLNGRNHSIVILFLYYGLTLQEVIGLKMKDIHFENNTIDIISASSLSRTITIRQEDKLHLYHYYKTIPKPVLPRYHSHDPFFLAFDFQRYTYRWVYESDQPKGLTEIALQKMLREEVKRAGLRKGISAQHLRHTYVLTKLKSGVAAENIIQQLGLKSPIAIKRYLTYLENTLDN